MGKKRKKKACRSPDGKAEELSAADIRELMRHDSYEREKGRIKSRQGGRLIGR